MDVYLHPIENHGCDYLSVPKYKLISISKRRSRDHAVSTNAKIYYVDSIAAPLGWYQRVWWHKTEMTRSSSYSLTLDLMLGEFQITDKE